MASRADTTGSAAAAAAAAGAGTAGPAIGEGFRAAATDFYFNSWRLVPANVIWGIAAMAVAAILFVWPPAGLAALPLLALPTVGVFRVAARIVRSDGDVSFRDAFAAMRAYAAPTLLLGVAFVATSFILATNVIVAITGADPARWAIGTLAAWGLVIEWSLALAVWPLLVDPARADASAVNRLRLAVLVLLAQPARSATLGIMAAAIVVVSTLLTAALLTVGVAFVALVACRFVYPIADRLEVRLVSRRT